MRTFERWYYNTIKHVLKEGQGKQDRTNTSTLSTFTVKHTHNLITEGFPILSGREFILNQSVVEMIGFMRGVTNSNWFKERGCPFWNKFGVKEDRFERKRKPDYELAHEYCSDGGKYLAHHQTYRDRYDSITKLGVGKGTEVIVNSGVELYNQIKIASQGDLGPIYGAMWRNWPNPDGTKFDQLEYAYNELLTRPYNRRILVSGWNPSFMPDFDLDPGENVPHGNMSLTPCHVLHEYYTEEIDRITRNDMAGIQTGTPYLSDEKLDELGIPRFYLDIAWFQRSWDFILGAPANWMGYAAMLSMMAKCVNMVPRYVDCTGINVHIYKNHLPNLQILLDRYENVHIPDEDVKLIIQPGNETRPWEFEPDQLSLVGYECLEPIKFPIAV